jgi:hypothetical protein
MVAVAATAAFALPAAASAAVPSATVHRYNVDYHSVAHKFGTRAAGRNIIKWGLAGGKHARSSDVKRSIGILERMLHPAPVLHIRYTPAPAPAPAPTPAPAAPSTSSASSTASAAPAAPTATSSGGYSSVPGVPASFAACVAKRESSNGAGSSNIYGIIPASGYSVAGKSVAQQKQVFSQLYAKVGTSGWSPYDGC